jgi:hypothetical protein
MRFLQRLLLVLTLLFVFVYGLNRGLSGRFGAHPILRHVPVVKTWVVAIAPTTEAPTGSVQPGNVPILKRHEDLFWLGTAMIPILYGLLGIVAWRRRPGAFRVQSTQGEVLLLEPAALIKFARVLVENHPAVVTHKVKVRQSGGKGLSITARVSVRPIQSLPAIRASLEQAIRDGFSRVMGIEKIDEIRIILGLDERSLGQRPGSNEEPEPRPEPPTRATLSPASPETTDAMGVEGASSEVPALRREAADDGMEIELKTLTDSSRDEAAAAPFANEHRQD